MAAIKLGGKIAGLPHFDVTVKEENLDSMMKMMLPYIKKTWDVNKLERIDYTSGITNRLVGYFMKESSESANCSEIILMRVYGAKTELLINRAQELQNLEELSNSNIAPPVYCTFENGYCYKFIKGKVCGPLDFTKKDVLQLSAHCMAQIHTVKLSDKYLSTYKMEPMVFNTISKYLALIPPTYNTVEKQTMFKSDVPTVEQLRKEVDIIFQVVANLQDVAVTYCHNDLLLANCIIDEEDGKMRCIDHEYGAPNYSTYDIGNHFNEFAGVDTVDYNLFPEKETQLYWLRMYLEKVNELTRTNREVLDEDVEKLYINVAIMTLLSHLFWGIWALIQAQYSQIDFDFMSYCIIRLNEYFVRKSEVLSELKKSSG